MIYIEKWWITFTDRSGCVEARSVEVVSFRPAGGGVKLRVHLSNMKWKTKEKQKFKLQGTYELMSCFIEKFFVQFVF